MRWFWSLALSMVCVFSLLFLLAERAGLMDAVWIAERVTAIQSSRGGLLATAAVLAGLLTVDLVLPVPSSLVMTLSGTLLGWHWGWIVNLVGSMGAAVLGFAFCRHWGRAAFDRLIGAQEAARIGQFFNRYGVWAILLSRSLPMLTEVISCLAGLSALRFRTFFWLALVGTGPLCLLYAWAGSRSMDPAALGWALLPAFGIPAIGFALVRWMPSLRRRH